MKNQSSAVSYDQQIANLINVQPGMKLSVVWRQFDSALNSVSANIAKHNAALAKTLPMMKKKQMVSEFNALLEGKYIKFPDGSQARY